MKSNNSERFKKDAQLQMREREIHEEKPCRSWIEIQDAWTILYLLISKGSLGHLLNAILTFNHFFMRVEPWNYNKQVFKVSKVINVYTYQMFKLWSNFNIKAEEAKCIEKKKEKKIKKINKSFSFHHSTYNIKRNNKLRYSMIRMFEGTNHSLYLLSI